MDNFSMQEQQYSFSAFEDVLRGPPGFSPTINVSDITGGHRLTITDVNGVRTVDVMDGESVTVDSALSPSSTNPVQNKVIYAALNDTITNAQIDALFT